MFFRTYVRLWKTWKGQNEVPWVIKTAANVHRGCFSIYIADYWVTSFCNGMSLRKLLHFATTKNFQLKEMQSWKHYVRFSAGMFKKFCTYKPKTSNAICSKIIKRKQVNEVFLLTLLLSLNKFYAFLWYLQKQPPEVVYTKKFSLKNL